MGWYEIKSKSRVKIPMSYDYEGKRNEYVYIEAEEDYNNEILVSVITDYGEIAGLCLNGNYLYTVLYNLAKGVYA